jgi:hypothetical protein
MRSLHEAEGAKSGRCPIRVALLIDVYLPPALAGIMGPY